MAEHVISLNPIQLENLTVPEATEFILNIVNQIISHFRETLFPPPAAENKHLKQFAVTMEWYFRSMVRIISDVDTNYSPNVKVLGIIVTSLNRIDSNFIEKTVDPNTPYSLSEIPNYKLWEMLNLLLIGNFYYLKDNTPNKFLSKSDNLFEVVTNNISNISRILSVKCSGESSLEANFYKIKLEVQTNLLSEVMKGL